MSEFVLQRSQVVTVPIEEAWRFYASPDNLQAITPPWLFFRVEQAPDELTAGSLLHYRLRLFGVPIRWLTEIRNWDPPRSFVDRQLQGPYRLREHTHTLTPVEGGTEIRDRVRYRVPGGRPVDLIVRGWLKRIFDYRAKRTSELLSTS